MQDKMPERVAAELAQSLQSELTALCPEESWGGMLFDGDAQVEQARIVDGNLVLDVERNGKLHELTLKPISWKRKR